jgi:hypothetical protein
MVSPAGWEKPSKLGKTRKKRKNTAKKGLFI